METRWGQIDCRIIIALGLSEKEFLVFESIAKQTYGKTVRQMAKRTGLPWSTVKLILPRLEKRQLVKNLWVDNKSLWLYKKGLEK